MTNVPLRQARATGALYLLTHVTSVAAVMAYGLGELRAGVALEFALALGCAGTGAILWALLRDRGPARAATFALLRAAEAAVILAGAVPMLALALSGATSATAEVSRLHEAAFLLGQGLVIAVNTIVLASLLWESRLVPRVLAGLGVAGGVIVLGSNVAQLWGFIPLNGGIAAIAAVPIFAFELWFAVTLLSVGLRASGTWGGRGRKS